MPINSISPEAQATIAWFDRDVAKLVFALGTDQQYGRVLALAGQDRTPAQVIEDAIATLTDLLPALQALS